ncbi:hypothetical protein FHW69_002345 [Luteibacter sp. Sphag1AF]|uniref:hypothetical protein n=1 Tax=Luteibacter sp. Sphag1AF TaxID=2587031 RepID=UPI0018174CF2|nr:hypothetical protein [Luteibacter sp. Sphag1AF]MBB3227722.1 hypothetical protein [Luteibacter sp. Sphag1AF]
MNRLTTVAAMAAVVAVSSTQARPPRAPWVDDFESRLQALALLETLNSDLLSHPSATLTLERWCGEHGMADPAKVVANRVPGADKPLPEGARAELGIDDAEPVRYRRVQLACGGHVLSEADNWYVPSRLTPEMNRTLDTTDQPFGKVVQPLGFRRQTTKAELLWSPLPRGWEMGAPVGPSKTLPLAIPHEVLQHRAVLYTAGNQPFSLVVETYTADVLTFPAR